MKLSFRWREELYFTAALAVNLALCAFFYNKFWWPPDAGVFAHVAERVLDGEILHKQVEEVHTGYNIFVNALTFHLQDRSFLALRYPLMAVTLLQSVFLFCVLRARSLPAAFLGSVAATVFGVIHFLNPVHHWYCLFGMAALMCTLACLPREARWRLFFCGYWIVFIYLFRQLSGVFALIGVLSYLLMESDDTPKRPWLAKALAVVLWLGTAVYVFRSGGWWGSLLFGIWPLIWLGWVAVKTKVSARSVLAWILPLFLGGIVAFWPMLMYHVAHGSITHWLDDTFWRALTVVEQPFLQISSFPYFLGGGLSQLFSSSWSLKVNGLYWIFVMLIGVVHGCVLIAYLRRMDKSTYSKLSVPALAVIYGLAALHNQIPVYIYFMMPLLIVSLFWMLSDFRRWSRVVFAVILLCAVAVSLYFHAAQPLVRDQLAGQRYGWLGTTGLIPKTRLMIDPPQLNRYSALSAFILNHTQDSDTIWAVPNNAELYFITGRKNPFRFFSTDHGLQSQQDVHYVIDSIRKQPPKLIIFSPMDKRNTPMSREVLINVMDMYELLSRLDYFEIYQLKSEHNQ